MNRALLECSSTRRLLSWSHAGGQLNPRRYDAVFRLRIGGANPGRNLASSRDYFDVRILEGSVSTFHLRHRVRVNLWPRWLRILLVGAITAAILGGGWFVYRYFAKPTYLTVAAGSADGEALSLISAISARLAASNAHIRLKVSDSGTSAKAAELLAAGKVR
jgi:hypothetical protein